MYRAMTKNVLVVVAAFALSSCHREASSKSTASATSSPPILTSPAATSSSASGSAIDAGVASVDAAPPPEVHKEPRAIGPYAAPFVEGRDVYYVAPSSWSKPQRLIANLHGMCNPPGYACGYWTHAASEQGFLVCPTGNAECAKGVPTWTEGFDQADDDLEKAIATVEAQYPDEISRDGSILTGFSLGATMASLIAMKHPARWPYLILIEAQVALSVEKLRAAGVRAVALIAGEIGANVYGDRAITDALNAQGFPARFWIMPKAGHYYSANIDDIMKEAMEWLLAQGDGDAGAATATTQ
jgi:predicted esterase